MKNLTRVILAATVAASALGFTACGGNADHNAKVDAAAQVRKQIDQHAQERSPYAPHNDVEFNNYNKAQQLYDSPNTIIFCTTTWGNASAPLVTVPVAGKLTSSSTSFYPSTKWVDRGEYNFTEVQQPSVDGMYHPNPPQYRYGFTPGGQYVDFFNMPTFCTTALTKFQRQVTKLAFTNDQAAKLAQSKAEAALRSGDKAGAERALATLEGSG